MRRKGVLIALVLVLVWALAAWAQESVPKPTQTQQAAQQPQGRVVYHGNVRSHKFHRPGCRHYNCKSCTARFTSRKQALRAGYVPCKVCKP